MDPSIWPKVEQLLNDALELGPEARALFINAIADPIIRREVESLAAAATGSETFLLSPAMAFSADLFDEQAPNLTGRSIGNYEVIGELGRGGMGAVYRAVRTDGKFDQDVAIKLLKSELNTADFRRRFSQERHILARLTHPNIARLLDAGTTTDGVPFLVMEYVDGVPITDYCDREGLGLRTRIELFSAVCEAISYAHSRLVIHRDLKPSNILVTETGTPKLLDFGISKLITAESDGESSNTVTWLGAMTPQYASPEQLRGESVTTATDVYSLGVIFYELLTGQRPLGIEKLSVDEVIRRVCDTEPERPSSVVYRIQSDAGANPTQNNRQPVTDRKWNTRSLRGDLDNIVLKALSKDPGRRYTSVEQFTEDIRRHLADVPVLARPDTLSYRATKFVNRNRIAVAAGVLILISLVAGSAATFWQARKAEASSARAERRFTEVRGLANALLNDVASKIERLEGSTEARRAVVEQSLKYLDSLSSEAADDRALQSELAAAYEKVGVLQGDSRKPSLSDFRGAIESLNKAQAIRRALIAAGFDDSENMRLLAENLRLLGIRQIYQNDAEGGIRSGNEAVQIYEKLVADHPDSLALKTAHLEARIEDAGSYADLGRFSEAVPMLQQTKTGIEALLAENTKEAEIHRIHARCLAYLGYSLSWEGQQSEAETEMARAVEISESLANGSPNDVTYKQDLWKAYHSASMIYEEINDSAGLRLGGKARKVIEEIIESDPANAQARHNLAMTLSRMGISAVNLGRPDEALGYLERGAKILSEIKSRDPLNNGYDHDFSALQRRIGSAKHKKGDLAGALIAYEQSRDLLVVQNTNDPGNTRALRNMAVAFRDLGLIHRDHINITSGDARRRHIELSMENYTAALEAWDKAANRNVMTDSDRAYLEEARNALDELEKIRS